jgi:hypothetical protein
MMTAELETDHHAESDTRGKRVIELVAWLVISGG